MGFLQILACLYNRNRQNQPYSTNTASMTSEITATIATSSTTIGIAPTATSSDTATSASSATPTSNGVIKLFCLVSGLSVDDAFPVVVAKGETVGDFKKLVREEGRDYIKGGGGAAGL